MMIYTAQPHNQRFHHQPQNQRLTQTQNQLQQERIDLLRQEPFPCPVGEVEERRNGDGRDRYGDGVAAAAVACEQ